jgi:RNA polymerase sigma-70 factor (ECF subfamily)
MGRSDQDLIRLIRKQDAGAFEELYARHRGKVRRYLERILRPKAAAEDLLQEVFLRVWTRAGQWDGRGNAAAWLRRIATNLALNHIRSERRRRQRPLEVPSPEADEGRLAPAWMVDAATLGPEAVAEQAERAEKLHRLLLELPEEKQELLRLVYEAGMDIPGAADRLGIPRGTVKSRLFSVRKRIAEVWHGIERKTE